MGRSVLSTPERNTLNRTIAGTPCVSVNNFKLLCQGHFLFRYYIRRDRNIHLECLRGVANSVGRRRRKSVVNQVLKDRKMKSYVVTKVGRLVKELNYTCTRNAKSL